MEPLAGLTPKVTHAVPLGGSRDMVAALKQHTVALSCPSYCKHLNIRGFYRKSPAPPPPHKFLQRQGAAYLCLSHLRHGVSSPELGLRFSISSTPNTKCPHVPGRMR